VSEQILNDTSAQKRLYSAIHVSTRWKIRTEDKSKTDTLQNRNTTKKKQTTQNTAKENYPGSVASYDTLPGNDGVL